MTPEDGQLGSLQVGRQLSREKVRVSDGRLPGDEQAGCPRTRARSVRTGRKPLSTITPPTSSGCVNAERRLTTLPCENPDRKIRFMARRRSSGVPNVSSSS